MAVLVSLVSLAIAALSLGWIIYRDAVMKARIRVSFGWRDMIDLDSGEKKTVIMLSGVNHGPGKATPETIQLRMRGRGVFPWPLRYGIVKLAKRPHPYSDMLPKLLDVGEKCNMVFPPSIGFARQSFIRIGFSDNFGQVHWAPRSDVRAFVKSATPTDPKAKGKGSEG